MKRYIIGLGNPGEEYEHTRHNVGFLFIDYLIGGSPDILSTQKKFKDSYLFALNDNTLLMKPLTFMNNSGRMVKELVTWFEINIQEELVIVHDDLDISLGVYKFQKAKSPRDHKGIHSIESHLGSVEFYRLRIGIENRKQKNITGEKYVLEDFKQGELDTLEQTFYEIVESERLKILS